MKDTTFIITEYTKTFSQENEKDQKQNEKDKMIFSFANNLKTMHLDKYPETGT